MRHAGHVRSVPHSHYLGGSLQIQYREIQYYPPKWIESGNQAFLTVKVTSQSSGSNAPRQRRGRNADMGVSANKLERIGKIGP